MSWEIHCGDAAEVLPRLDIRPQLILTSPPYGALRDFGGHGFDFESVADAIVSVMSEGSVLVWVVWDQVIDGSESGDRLRQVLGFMERGLFLHQTMCFLKAGSGGKTFGGRRHHNEFEEMYVLSRGRPRIVNIIGDVKTAQGGQDHYMSTHRSRDGSLRVSKSKYVIPRFTSRSNVWRIATGLHKSHPGFSRAHDHPATFPFRLAADHVRTWTNPGDLVLDPMAGSGTTMRAAETLGRNSVGVEIHEPYCEIIRARMAQQNLEMEYEDDLVDQDADSNNAGEKTMEVLL